MSGFNPDDFNNFMAQGNGVPPQMRTANGFSVKHPYHSYYPAETTSDFYAAPTMPMSNREVMMQHHYGHGGHHQRQAMPQRSDMNPNAAAFIPGGGGSGRGFNPFGYGANQPQQRSFAPQQPAPQAYNNYMTSYNNGPDYGNVNNGGYPPLPSSQPVSKPSQQQAYQQAMLAQQQHQQQQQAQQQHHQQQQQQQQAQQQQASQSRHPDPLYTLRQDIVQQKQQSENDVLRRQQDQEAYAQRFLEAVQQRVSSAPTSQHQQQAHMNGYMMADAGSYFDQDIDAYDFEVEHRQNPPFQLSQDLLNAIEELPNKLALFEVQIGLEQLLSEPTEFEAWSGAVKERLASKEVTKKDLEVAAWLIIEMGIQNEDTQHNFAKLCHHLYERISSFKDLLLGQIRIFHDGRSQLSPAVRQNFLLFLGEVYEQALAPVGIRNHPFVQLFIEELQEAVGTRPISDLLLKKIVLVLKLCGRHLEMDAGKDTMEDIFSKLDSYTKDAGRPDGMTDTGAGLITNLLMFRNSGWGGANDAPARRLHDPSMDLTEDEINFLDQNGAMNRPLGSSQSASNSEVEEFDSDDYDRYFHAQRTAIAAAEKALERLSIEEEDFDVPAAVREDSEGEKAVEKKDDIRF
uniref:MIF4G domain-containing protein n=1 Tax=Panagrellus redivivus TaxID=6233 RepID=A0A7E4UNK2_PANRE